MTSPEPLKLSPQLPQDLAKVSHEFHNETKVREIISEALTPLMSELLTCQRTVKTQGLDIKRL